MSARIHGDNGKLVVGGEPGQGKVASLTDWSLQVDRDYVDAGTSFYSGERSYVKVNEQVTGSFELALSDDNPLFSAMSSPGEVSVFVYTDTPLPWYQAWFYRLFARWKTWPTTLLYGGRAYLDWESNQDLDGMAETSIKANFVGPVTYHFYETPVGRLKNASRARVNAIRAAIEARSPVPPEPALEDEPEREPVGHYWCDQCNDAHMVYADGTDEMGNMVDLEDTWRAPDA